ncbi:Cytoplasmic dynein 1 intermediate chain 2 [Cyphomyrmex costatus]|uniref:Cytoplasmic dynein 1 intermediate chain 2 n=1 Tax=Cyphomyrmex costatus TaxID=456900 RepID=A0A195D246_9HYME|nr:Cytoplasmic dynein 1 intermediate chain 2 [Cyphomyrmex costatus]
MNWSPQFPELLAASYNNNDDVPNGAYLIWNTKFKKITPEFIFHCQSPVISTTFARFHPNLILGCVRKHHLTSMVYFGQIVLLDNRFCTPIQRTPLSATAHTHPVYCLNVVGIQITHNLISISTDGKLCSWVNNFVMGSEDGTVYLCKCSCPCIRAGLTEIYLLIGNDTGKIWVYDAAEHLAHPRIDEWNNFLYTQ